MSGDSHDGHDAHDDHDDHGHHAAEPYFGEAVPANQAGIVLPILWIIATLSVGVITALVAASNEFGW